MRLVETGICLIQIAHDKYVMMDQITDLFQYFFVCESFNNFFVRLHSKVYLHVQETHLL